MLQEKREMSFVEHTLCPHMKALGVDVRSEVLSIDGWDNRDISAALCKRAGELHPELMVRVQGTFFASHAHPFCLHLGLQK